MGILEKSHRAPRQPSGDENIWLARVAWQRLDAVEIMVVVPASGNCAADRRPPPVASPRRRCRKQFFFEKKNQKTFAKLGFGLSGQAEAKMIKSFLLPAGRAPPFFLKKKFLLPYWQAKHSS
jgi:hypothetical protein